MTKFEDKYQIRFPRTWRGWKALFWLSIGRCPVHHKPLHFDPWQPSLPVMMGFCCEGIGLWPNGMMQALRGNYRAELKKEQK